MRLPLLVGAAIAAVLPAQSVVVPAANATVRGSSQLNSIIRNAANPRTYMFGINAGELAGIPVGAAINGLSLRFMPFGSNSASWPAADIVWNNFTGNFMANFAAVPVQVRSGPMVLPAGSFTNTNPPAPGVNAWSTFYFDFQVPYVYTGGDLALLFSHPGSTDTATAQYPEVVASSAGTHGVAYVQSVYPVGTAGAVSTFYVHRLHFGFGSGCPGSGGKVPNLVQSQNTHGGLGGPIRLAIGNGPASGVGLVALGFVNVPIPLGNGCTLVTVPVASSLLLLDAAGNGAFTLNVPPGAVGSLLAQAVVIDSGAPGGFTVSNGVTPQAL